MVKCVKIGHLLSSSLWITVLIVRVGCLIEAHASTVEAGADDDGFGKDNNKDEDLMVSSATFALSRQARLRKKSLSSSSSSTSRRLYSSKNLINSNPATTASMIGLLPEVDDSDDDGCTGKGDGYFPNYASDCTSYYFCAAGYQITYVCPPDTRFNEKSKKCEDDAKCLSKGHHNICGNVANGYYTNDVNSPKYFYCYNNAKVIDLSCDYGKVFNGNKCIFPITPNANHINQEQYEADLEHVSCTNKPNGFYPIIDSGCTKYYFCIDHVKTELQCETGLVFNTEVCVHPTRYKCPNPLSPSNSSGNSISDSETNQSEHNSDNFETTSLPTTTVF